MSLTDLLSRGEHIRPDELAQGLKVAKGTVYMWVERGLIPHLRIGKVIRFDPEDLRAWLKASRVGARKEPGDLHTVRTT